jgi:ParB-like chromosome segregation protein Spo0J
MENKMSQGPLSSLPSKPAHCSSRVHNVHEGSRDVDHNLSIEQLDATRTIALPAFSEPTTPVPLAHPAAPQEPAAHLRAAVPKQALKERARIIRNVNLKRQLTRPPNFAPRGFKTVTGPTVNAATDREVTSFADQLQESKKANREATEPQSRAPVTLGSDRVISKIPIADVAVDVGHDVDTKNVEILADSFRYAGQTSAILVVREEHGSFRVISGIHRVVAAKQLEWDQIDAVVLDCGERGLRLIQIAEDLHRRQLSALERSELTYEWIQLIHQEAVQHAQPSGGRQPNDRGLSKAARALGVSKEETMRAARIAGISPEGKSKARELGFQDNQAVLLQVAKLSSPHLQIEHLHEISERKKAPRRPASKRHTEQALQGEGSGSPTSTSAASFQLLPPEQDLSLPEELDQRNVAEHLERLKLKWSDFRPFLLNAPIAARRQFIQEVLMPDWLIQKNVAIAKPSNPVVADDQGGAT